MHYIYKPYLKTYMKGNTLYVVFQRHVRSTCMITEKENLKYDKPAQKITVLERKYSKNKGSSIVVKYTSAADAIKRINWENKVLFGSAQTKSHSYDNELKNYEQLIQQETRIPIIEPPDSNTETIGKDRKIDLNSVLTFPLINKFVHSSSKINEVNYLRKYLQFHCENSTVPAVTQILKKTMPIERVKILDAWKQNLINQLGQEDFEKYQAELFANGVSLHHSISSFLSSLPEADIQIKDENVGHWKSLKHILPKVTNVKLLEEFVTHPFLCYRGVVDCFAKYKDHLVVIDWKTSKKSKVNIKNTYDDPLQIAAYVGALNFDPKFQYLASKGLIVIAYENGMPATAHFLDQSAITYYWNEWLKRVKQFWEMKISETD